MWQIYGSLGFGVALKSSVEQYKTAARFEVDPSHYIFGEVVYHPSLESSPDIQRDFRESTPMPGRGLWSEILKLGVHETFDLEQLISAVYVGPRAEGFVVEAVSSIMEKFLLKKPLMPSLLLSSPLKAVASVD